jgi:hypothetical protein
VQSDMSSSSASQHEDTESSTSAPVDEAAHNDANNVRGRPGATTRSQTAALGRRDPWPQTQATTDTQPQTLATADTRAAPSANIQSRANAWPREHSCANASADARCCKDDSTPSHATTAAMDMDPATPRASATPSVVAMLSASALPS